MLITPASRCPQTPNFDIETWHLHLEDPADGLPPGALCLPGKTKCVADTSSRAGTVPAGLRRTVADRWCNGTRRGSCSGGQPFPDPPGVGPGHRECGGLGVRGSGSGVLHRATRSKLLLPFHICYLPYRVTNGEKGVVLFTPHLLRGLWRWITRFDCRLVI